MKKLAALFSAMLLSIALFAQYNLTDPVPMDTSIRCGKLPNGLTYYICHNEKTKNRCEFRLLVDVGAIVEQDNENGLAHFLEHLCFGGTKHFPGKSLINYFESVGVSYGKGVNASTSLDETLYKLSDIPTTRWGILDTALLVLRDWSCAVLLRDEAIESERGIIREEWRTRNAAWRRMYDKQRQLSMPGSQYAKRDVIGDTAIINNFKPQTLRDFYHRWYGPDLQAVIVVGDIDVDKMEKKIVKLFSPIKARKGLTPRPRYGALDNEKPITGVYLDHEAQYQDIEIGFKHPARPKKDNNTYAATMENAKRALIRSCLFNRLYEKNKSAGSPLFSSDIYCGYGNMNGETDAFYISVSPENGKEATLYRAMCEELERIRRYGILAEELQFVRKEQLSNLQRRVKTSKDRENDYIIGDCLYNFLHNSPITTAQFDLDFFNNYTSKVTVEELNEMLKDFFNPDDRNMYIVATGKAAPDQNGIGCSECRMPTENELLAIYQSVKDSSIDAPTFTNVDKPLVQNAPTPGKIVSKKHNDDLDVDEIQLSNGVKIIVKQTAFEINYIYLDAKSKGGYATYPLSDHINAYYADAIVRNNGVGDFTPEELDKLLAGKRASAHFNISSTGEYIHGSSSTDDFETMLQLIYLNFTAPRKDDERFNKFLENKKSRLITRYNNPYNEFYDRLSILEYGNSARLIIPDTNNIKQLNQERAIQIYKERFANPADFTFFIVGDINLSDSATIAGIEKWIGGLHTTDKLEEFTSDSLDIVKGTNYDYFKRTMDTPTATNHLIVTGYGFDFSLANVVKTELIQRILSTRFVESIREKESGTYGVSVYCYLAKYNTPHVYLEIEFDTDPDKQNRLLSIIYDEIEKIIKEGPLESDLAKEKQILLNTFEDNLRQNWFWQNGLNDYYNNGFNYIKEYENTLYNIKGEDIRQMLKQLYEQKNIIEAVMMPARN